MHLYNLIRPLLFSYFISSLASSFIVPLSYPTTVHCRQWRIAPPAIYQLVQLVSLTILSFIELVAFVFHDIHF